MTAIRDLPKKIQDLVLEEIDYEHGQLFHKPTKTNNEKEVRDFYKKNYLRLDCGSIFYWQEAKMGGEFWRATWRGEWDEKYNDCEEEDEDQLFDESLGILGEILHRLNK